MYLSESAAIEKVKKFFKNREKRYSYQNKKGNTVNCFMKDDGIEVDCLSESGHKNFLPWGVFWHAVHIMLVNGGKACRGVAISQGGLGSDELPFISVEGHVANVIYGKQSGDAVFRRISPIAHILIASEICIHQRGDMELVRIV